MKNIFLILPLCLSLTFFSCAPQKSSEALPSVVAEGPLEYVLEDISGTVLVQSADGTQPEQVEEEQIVQSGDEIMTQAGSEASLTLNETTLFHLSENSDVRVDQLDRNANQGFISRLHLVAGKILSEVEKLSESNSTFEVNSGGVVCGVRGTSFEVEKQDSDIQTTTYNGVVETQKENNVQTIAAEEHGDYSLSQGAFLPKRSLTPEERARYENWKTRLARVREKCRARLEALRALDRLPAEQREKILQQLSGVRARDRLKALRQKMEEGNSQTQDQDPLARRGENAQAQREQDLQQRQENRQTVFPQNRDKKP